MHGKKKLLIVNNNLATGGVQRSLINLLNEIKNDYDITLFLFNNNGEYKKSIPQEIEVVEAKPLLSLLGVSQIQSKNLGMFFYYVRAILSLYSRIVNNHFPIKLLVSTQPKLSGFDAAISFLHDSKGKRLYGGCNEFVQRRVETETKITFLHCDFINYGGNNAHNRKMLRKFNKVVAVSEGIKNSLINALPELKDKTFYVSNCHNYTEYQRCSGLDTFEYRDKFFNILTVARLSPEKGILRSIDIFKRVINEGYSVKWHIVGDGIQKKEIEDKILSSNMNKVILLYGNQVNPYRFMKYADVLYQPSFHEAAPMVFQEAKSLGLPIITTETISAKELIVEGNEGFICDNSENGIYSILKVILDAPKHLQACREYLSKQKYTNEKALFQFQSLFE